MIKRQNAVAKLQKQNKHRALRFDDFDAILQAIKQNMETDFELQHFFNI